MPVMAHISIPHRLYWMPSRFANICATIKATDEERHLTSVFGEEYRKYMNETGRFAAKFGGGSLPR